MDGCGRRAGWCAAGWGVPNLDGCGRPWHGLRAAGCGLYCHTPSLVPPPPAEWHLGCIISC